MLSKWKVDMVGDVAHRCASGYGHSYELVRDTSSRMYDVFVDASLATRVNSLDDAKQWIETMYGGTQDAPTIPQGAPIVPPPSNEHGDALDALDVLKKVLGGGGNIGELAAEIDGLKATVEEIKAAQKSAHAIHEIHITQASEMVVIPPQIAHNMLPTILGFLSNDFHVYLVGPAGGGKTHLGHQIAKILGREFYSIGAMLQKYEVLGFINVNGLERTPFRDAYEFGGVFQIDELDACSALAVNALNSALENGFADFPDGRIKRHPDFVCIANGNTFGKGADRVYVGRLEIDGASLERFAVLSLDYDEKLEEALTGEDEIGKSWVKEVQVWRRAAAALKVRHIISPRASIKGAVMLRTGMERSVVEEALVWKGLDVDTVRRIKEYA